ncbi:MAG: FKBP-type peptidyl-prolyl cis-trans isomerase, partial [Micrococcales bacterium]|nr:FKBP-type peptidyl-prolyl cis-trans isomerase [Micrococcales bacterium]
MIIGTSIRRSLVAGIVGAAVVMSLTACGSERGPAPPSPPRPSPTTTPAQDQSVLGDVGWFGDCGSQTERLAFIAPLEIRSNEWGSIGLGTGAVIEPGQKVVFDALVYDAQTGEQVANSYNDGQAMAVQLAGEGQAAGADPFYEPLVGQKIGACVLVAIAGVSSGSDQPDQPGLLVAVTVIDATNVLERATGESVAQTEEDLPHVSLETDGRPVIEIPSSVSPPTKLEVRDLIIGSGPAVNKDQTLTVHYTGWLWSDGSAFDSSWENSQPATFPLSGVI